MTAIDDLFGKLKSQGKKAFMPFITAADPNLGFTRKVLGKLDQLGCSMAEVGIPYSDPIADGPVIQASYTRALEPKSSFMISSSNLPWSDQTSQCPWSRW